jgi:hypothetical protein
MNKKIYIELLACTIQPPSGYYTKTYFDIEKISYIKEHETDREHYCTIGIGGLAFKIKSPVYEILSKIEKSGYIDFQIIV